MRTNTGDSNPITVAIASDRMVLPQELLQRLACEPGINIVSALVETPACLPMCLAQWHPTLLLLYKGVLDQLDPQALAVIRAQIPRVHVLLVWDEVYPSLVEEILRNRFRGYLLTNDPYETYVKAVRAVSRGEIWLPRGSLAKACSDLLETPSLGDAKAESDRHCANGSYRLTKRQEEIVRLLSQGFTNKQIAQQLDIMEDTVKKHLQKIFDKLGVRRRTLVVLSQVGGATR